MSSGLLAASGRLESLREGRGRYRNIVC